MVCHLFIKGPVHSILLKDLKLHFYLINIGKWKCFFLWLIIYLFFLWKHLRFICFWVYVYSMDCSHLYKLKWELLHREEKKIQKNESSTINKKWKNLTVLACKKNILQAVLFTIFEYFYHVQICIFFLAKLNYLHQGIPWYYHATRL